MTNNQLFSNAEKLYLNLTQDLILLKEKQTDYLLLLERSLMCIDIAVRKLKNQLLSHEFSSLAEEVYFFKNLKPKFISEYLFYAELLEIETSKPHSGKKNIEKFYQARIRKIKIYYDDNRDLYNYYKRQATYLDHKYFVRQSFDLKMKLPQQLYNYDERFTTSHDDYISGFMTNEKLLNHIHSELKYIDGQSLQESQSIKRFQWTSSKAALVELIYALYSNHSINAGAVELNEIIKTFERIFIIDLSNFHKTLVEIKSRKTNPTKFLSQLSDNLNQYFQTDDE